MRHEIQRAVMIGLSLAVVVGAGACLTPPGVACGDAWCSDREHCVSLESNVNVDEQQLMCVTKLMGQSCMANTDCAPVGICDTHTGRCRVARSCAEILQHIPGSGDGVYSIAPDAIAPFSAVCDMTRDGGGWTLLLKATGDTTLGYSAPAWTDDNLLNTTDLTTKAGNAKYQSFLSLPLTTLRGELDGFRYTKDFASMTAWQIFRGPPAIVHYFPTINNESQNWSTQPNCQTFGVNTPFVHAQTRFGWSANEQNNCSSNDMAIGLGLMSNGTNNRGAGYECLASCSRFVNAGGLGLLWGRE